MNGSCSEFHQRVNDCVHFFQLIIVAVHVGLDFGEEFSAVTFDFGHFFLEHGQKSVVLVSYHLGVHFKLSFDGLNTLIQL